MGLGPAFPNAVWSNITGSSPVAPVGVQASSAGSSSQVNLVTAIGILGDGGGGSSSVSTGVLIYNGASFDKLRSVAGDGTTAGGYAAVGPYVYNGATFDRVRSITSADGTSGTGVIAAGVMGYNGTSYGKANFVGAQADASTGGNAFAVGPIVFNGTTYDRARSANASSNTTGTGLLGVGLMLFDGTNWQRNLNASGSDATSGGGIAATTQCVYNGSTYNVRRSASLSNFPTSQTTTGRNIIGVALSEKSSRWSVVSAPAAGSQASASIAAEAGVRHCLDSFSFTCCATAAPAVTKIDVVVRDGASGAGTIIWQESIVVTASASSFFGPQFRTGLNLTGSTNTSMTVEFSAGVVNVFEVISMCGFNVN